MKRYIFTGLCMCVAVGLAAQSYNELITRAMDCTLKDSLQQAELLFQKALKIDPSNARNALLFSNLGTVQKRMGKNKEAIDSYTMALNITPYSTAMLLNRAALYMEMGLEEKAYVDYCNVIDLLPNDVEARLYRAYIYMGRRQYKESRIDYNTILANDFTHREARLGLAMLDQKEGKYVSARDVLSQLIVECPTDITLLKMRANLDWGQEMPDAALLDLEEVIRISPADVEAYLIMGDIYLQQKKKSAARKAYECAVKLGASRVQVQEKLKQCR